MKIAILGAGAWGTAQAISFAGRHKVALWARDAELAQALAKERVNRRYLPESPLPDAVQPTADFAQAVSGADLVMVATATAGLRDVARQLNSSHAPQHVPVLWSCKGLEAGSALPPHRIVATELGDDRPCGALSGPSFALEVALGRPTALTLASTNEAFARNTARALHHAVLRVYYSTDVVGVEIGGAVKNVMAIATGISDGMGLGMNARAALITRGLAEISRLGTKLGGRPETFMGLAGAGDLILTCTGELSRNRRVGLLLAQGHDLERVLAQLGHVSEGVASAKAVQKMAREAGVDMPITEAVCAVLFGGLSPEKALQLLLSRDPKSES